VSSSSGFVSPHVIRPFYPRLTGDDEHQSWRHGLVYDYQMPTDRPDRTLCADVELALLLLDLVCTRHAGAFLIARGAPSKPTCRVIGTGAIVFGHPSHK
jgi:hypothetical protein